MKYKLNKEQERAVKSNADRILCLAGAGTGKTRTMIERIVRLVNDGVNPSAILALTFTNAAAFEMKSRYHEYIQDDITPEFRTFHSYCYDLLTRDVDIQKHLGYSSTPKIADEKMCKRIDREAALQSGISIPQKKMDDPSTMSLMERKNYDILMKCRHRLMKQKNLITFDELCTGICNLFIDKNPLIEQYREQIQYLCVDEYQDTDPIQHDFVMSFDGSAKIFVVGDALQCQPAGTKVTMSDLTTKNIEDIRIGDYVLAYSCAEGRYVQNLNINSNYKHRYTKRVLNVASRYADNIVEVCSDNHKSKYTKDHITYAKIHYEGNSDKYVVYLMHSPEGWWRVGSTHLFVDSNHSAFGSRVRMRCEGGDAVWILDVVPTSKDAWLMEQLVAYKYMIPQTTWTCKNVTYSRDDLHELYSKLNNLQEHAEQCLFDFGRDIDYPLFTKDSLNRHFSKLHIFEIRVGNLLPGIMDIVVPIKSEVDNKLHNTYEQITEIRNIDPQIVYSLDVEDYHNYVSDGILTHNCIYTFRGSKPEYIKSLSMDPRWELVRLSENYRSTKNICDFANEFSQLYADESYRTPIESDRAGDVVDIRNYSFYSYDSIFKRIAVECKCLTGTVAIIARTNKECDDIKEQLDKNEVKYSVNHKNVDAKYILPSVTDSEFLINWLATFLPSEQYSEFIRESRIKSTKDVFYTERQFIATFGLNPDIKMRTDAIYEIRTLLKNNNHLDYVYKEILRIIGYPKLWIDLSEVTTVSDLFSKILDAVANQPDQDADVYVGTIHSVKGLEYDTVYIMGVNGTHFRLTTEENKNVYYVAMTRAKDHLIIYS